MSDTLFVTGMQRSGTTLAERLLDGLPEHSILSQPFPLLFSRAKSLFFAELGIVEPFPLGNLFLEDRYQPAQWREFLDRWCVEGELLVEIFREMEGYSGQYTRFERRRIEDFASSVAPAPLPVLVRQLYRELRARPTARTVGGKEVICEEFIPALLDAGIEVLLVLRDPRDVLASLNEGDGRTHAGRLKPTLFNLRNWRKSAAYALALEGRAGFRWVRYEDLVEDPSRIAPATAAPSVAAWQGNSSFGPRSGIDARSVGTRGRLRRGVAEFAEACCLPELIALGYDVAMSTEQAAAAIVRFVDPYPLERPELGSYLDAARRDEELQRLDLVTRPAGVRTGAYFLDPLAHARLAGALGGSVA